MKGEAWDPSSESAPWRAAGSWAGLTAALSLAEGMGEAGWERQEKKKEQNR